MLSFVWLSSYPFLAGTGGSENYTAGQIRELRRRGIDTRIIIIGKNKQPKVSEFNDIPFHSLASTEELSELDDTLVFVTHPLSIPTKKQSYVILHCPLSQCDSDPNMIKDGLEDKRFIATSKFSARKWAAFFGRKPGEMPVAYPFASHCFGKVERPVRKAGEKIRVLFAGRLTPDKGIYTFMASLHFKVMDLDRFSFAATTAGNHTDEGRLVHTLLKAHPHINVVPARGSQPEMAALLAEHDIVIMPTTNQFWSEAFGMLSVEAQHAGCRVVASRSGGLPETDCGSLTLVDPDNPFALAQGIMEAAKAGPVSKVQRQLAAQKFRVAESVDSLLEAINFPTRRLAPAKVKAPLV